MVWITPYAFLHEILELLVRYPELPQDLLDVINSIIEGKGTVNVMSNVSYTAPSLMPSMGILSFYEKHR